MPRLQNKDTGAIINVSDDRAKRLGSEWGPVKSGKAPQGAIAPAAPAADEPLKGKALDAALKDAGLATDGRAEDKRARLAEYLAKQKDAPASGGGDSQENTNPEPSGDGE